MIGILIIILLWLSLLLLPVLLVYNNATHNYVASDGMTSQFDDEHTSSSFATKLYLFSSSSE